ncbi:hypothetical protein [uncultured Jatrophihabitans sp.]|uniref:hypothetical protein n=1 Tax=uncultured Jatrophihabitans sp. TaxID=1610747 RepID=UPI0035CAF30C
MAYGFDGGNYHHLYETEGKEPIDGTFHFTRHSFLGSEYNDGKADAFRKVKEGIDVEGLQEQARGWENVHTRLAGIYTKLDTAYQDLFSQGWDGDDADKARKTFGDTTASVQSIRDSADQMRAGTKRIATAAAAACGTESDGPSGGAKFVNATIGPFGGNGDGGADEQAYFTLVGEVDGGRDQMPAQLEWQTKTNAGGGDNTPTTNYGGTGSHGSGSGGGGVGAVSAPNSGVGTPAHTSTPTHSIGQSGQWHVAKTPKPVQPSHPDPGPGGVSGVDGSGGVLDTGTDGLANGGGSGFDSSSVSGAGIGGHGVGNHGVGLDSGSTLAGYDGSGLGGSGSGAGVGGPAGGFGSSASGLGSSAAGLGSGSASGLAGGLGAGSAAGLSSGSAGGLGSRSTEGSGGGSGRGAARAGTGGRGVAGGQIAPMRGGGGAGGDESERDRTTWLQEDEDVWGESDAPPSVIS